MATRVLVIEDEEPAAAFFHDALRELGYEPLLARTAEAARATLETERPDIILLDTRLPRMSGFDFLQLEAVRASGVPIVAVSGLATDDEARACVRYGALEFMRKPIQLSALREVLLHAELQTVRVRLDRMVHRSDRRRSAGSPITTPVQVTEDDGAEWRGTCVDLSTLGMKIRPDEAVTPGVAVRLHFTMPDGGPACDLLAVLVRQDQDAYVYRFVNLAGDDFGRLSECVRPVAAEEPAERRLTSAEPLETPASRRTGVHETILVVEDEQHIRDLVRMALDDHGYTVFAAADGREALQIAERHAGAIHLVLTDIVMPGMSGLELVELLTSAHPTMRVVYMSGYADERTTSAHRVHGALLRKPFTVEVLAAKVREVLDQPRSH